MVHALRILIASLLLLAAFRPVWGQWRQVAAEGEELDSVTWLAEANGMLFAAGSSTTWLVRSIDQGQNWERIFIGEGARPRALVHAFGEFLLFGEGGRFARSADGVHWRAGEPGVSLDLRSASVGENGTVVVVGGGGILTSSDGVAWSLVDFGASGSFRDVAYFNDRFVAVGDSGLIVTSPDGHRWNILPAPDGRTWSLSQVAVGDGTCVILSGRYIFASSDLYDWSLFYTGGAPLTGVAYSGGEWLAVDGFTVRRRGEDAGWEPVEVSPQLASQTRVLAAVESGFVGGGRNGDLFVTSDGREWTRTRTGHGHDLRAVVYCSGRYLAVGSGGTIWSSPDGQDWTLRESTTTDSLRAVAMRKGHFVANGGDIYLVSPDAISWRRVELEAVEDEEPVFRGIPCDSEPGDSDRWTVNDFAYMGGRFAYNEGILVEVGGKTMRTSSDHGITWTTHEIDDGGWDIWLSGVAYGNGRFVAVGIRMDRRAPGSLWASFDGYQWYGASSGPIESWYMSPYVASYTAIVFAGDRFVAGDVWSALAFGPGGVIGVTRDEFWHHPSFQSETYTEWVERFQPAVPGAGEDPMVEGLPLLLRYVLGLGSEEAGRGRLPVLRFVDDGLYRFAAFDLELRDQMPGVLISLEASDDLHEWMRVPMRQRFAEWTADQRKRVLLQDRRPIGENGNRYWRLRVQLGEE